VRAFAAVFEAVDRRLRLEFFERRRRFARRFAERGGVFAFGRELHFALDLGELFRRFHEFGVAAVVVGRGAQVLQAFHHPEVEVGALFDRVRHRGFRGFGPEGADGGVDLGADRVSLLNQFRFRQALRFFGGRRGRLGRVVTAAAAGDRHGREGGEHEEQGLVGGIHGARR